MNTLALVLILLPALLLFYSYIGYPLLLRALAPAPDDAAEPGAAEWPMITITVPVYNEEAQIRGLIESLLALEYPAEKKQILVVSDASSDRTDEIVAEYADRGIEFLRMPTRGGKTVAENTAAQYCRGEIVINTDATIRIRKDAIKPLIASFRDPTIGAASGRDVSVGKTDEFANVGEAGYVDYEMGVRALESRLDGIVGASGCFYAIRTELHRVPLHDSLSRDFAAALITRAHGYRTVSVDAAVCLVPRSGSLRREYRRKVRTMTRGIETLYHLRVMLSPRRYGRFAWMLFSHKVCRWLVPWTFPPALIGLIMLAIQFKLAAAVLALALLSAAGAGVAWFMDPRWPLPRWLAVLGYAWAGNVAAIHAGIRAMSGDQNALWEPTRRDVIEHR